MPALAAGRAWRYLKQGEKDTFDWPLADVAVVLDLRRCKLQSRRDHSRRGGARPLPGNRCRGEPSLASRINESTASEAARAALEGASPLAKNAYKLPLFETLVRRAISKAMGAGGA